MADLGPRPDYSHEDFAKELHVSRETLDGFIHWQKRLVDWNRKINLVAPSSLPDFWRRHALDSAQLWQWVPEKTQSYLDLGSGAGFPGIAFALLARERGYGYVRLVEAAGKKANFLKMLIRELNLPADVQAGRIETLESKPYDVISARALAPLPDLFGYAAPFWGPRTVGLFPKGEGVMDELELAKKTWIFSSKMIASLSHPGGHVIVISDLKPKSASGKTRA